MHVCYVGTVLPLGMDTLRAVLSAVAVVRARRPDLYARLRLHFFGTSNQRDPAAPPRVLPLAAELGVADRVTETPGRIDYLAAMTVLTQAGVILLMGSSERHYTASKLYPALLAERPLLAVYHEASSVTDILRRTAPPPAARLVTYGDAGPAGSRVEAIARELTAVLDRPADIPVAADAAALRGYSAESLAGVLAGVLDRARGWDRMRGRP